MKHTNIDRLFQPRSIALVGASAKPGKIGHLILQNIIEGGYQGDVYPVNPTATEILGLQVYPTVGAVPSDVDAAIIALPAALTPKAAQECGQKGVKGLVVVTSGYSEVGEDDLEAELVATARQYDMRVLGPNIVGFLANNLNLNASFISPMPLAGKVSLVSQSGALLAALNLASHTYKVGFEKLISIGNMADIDFADIITWLDEDESTTCIALYLEGIEDGRRFIEAGQKARKPIIALKSGVSAHGAAAAASHTGSLAGASIVYAAACKEAGMIYASGLGDLFNRSLGLSLQPPMKGDNLAIVTNGGGVGVLAADAAEKHAIPLHFGPADLQEELRQFIPEYGSAKNPVDLTGIAGPDWYAPSIRCTLAHAWVDALVVLFAEGAGHDPMDIAQAIKQAVDESGVDDKPVAVCFVGGGKSQEAMNWLVLNGIPAYNVPEEAVAVIAGLREYGRLLESRVQESREPTITRNQDSLNTVREVIARARQDGRSALTEIEANRVFAAYQLPVTPTYLAKSEAEVVEAANEIGYPLVIKIVSPDILHKSDAGGVKIDIADEQAARAAYHAIIENAQAYSPDANIHGVAVQAMAPAGSEVIIGSTSDPTFGPTLMFGLGGIFVELLKDVTVRVAPISLTQAEQMLTEIRSAPILAGARGEAPRDRAALADTLYRYSAMIFDLADEISETDANPTIVYEEGQGLKIVDARIILKTQ
jgi:acetyltransferase